MGKFFVGFSLIGWFGKQVRYCYGVTDGDLNYDTQHHGATDCVSRQRGEGLRMARWTPESSLEIRYPYSSLPYTMPKRSGTEFTTHTGASFYQETN
jgi:hypothetical protein